MRVFVYRNLRKSCYSVKALEGPNKGKVIAHAKYLVLTDCTFKVSKAGRERVLMTGQKNVHAGVVGQWDGNLTPDRPQHCTFKGYYNPHKTDSFIRELIGEPLTTAPLVYLGLTGIFYCEPENTSQVS